MSENVAVFLKILRNFPGGTVRLLAKEANISPRTVDSYLEILKKANIIRRVGTNRKGYWEIRSMMSNKNSIAGYPREGGRLLL